MTIPWLMNCAHSDIGWCLDCVANMGNELAQLRRAGPSHSYADQLNDMIRRMDKTAEHLATEELYGFADECRSVRNFLVELRDVRLAGPSHSYADVIAKQLGDRAGSWMNVQLSRGEWDEVVALLRLAGPGGGTWDKDDPRRVFVEGAKWWHCKASGATAFASEVDAMEREANKRYLLPTGPSGTPIEDSEVWKAIDWCLDVAKLEDMIGAPLADSPPYEIGVRRGLTIAQNILNGWRPKKMPPPATTGGNK